MRRRFKSAGVKAKKKAKRKRRLLPEEKFKRYMINAARDVWGMSTAKKAARAKALIRRERILNGTYRGKPRWKYIEYYRCAHCPPPLEYVRRRTHVDHIIPVVAIGGKEPVLVEPGVAEGWDEYLRHLWTDIGNLQVLCLSHHYKKTAQEKRLRVGSAVESE